jgi:hypothetical protein
MGMFPNSKKNFLPGGATPESLSGDVRFKRTFVSGMLHCDILKIVHHGQIDGIMKEFITAVSPKILIICSSSYRRYQSAHPDLYKNSCTKEKIRKNNPQNIVPPDERVI